MAEAFDALGDFNERGELRQAQHLAVSTSPMRMGGEESLQASG